MFAHQIRPTEVSLVLYIVEEIARDANFRAASAEKLEELARSPLARYSHHDPGDQAKPGSHGHRKEAVVRPASRRKGMLYRIGYEELQGRRGTIYENDTKTIDHCTAWRGDAHCGCGLRRRATQHTRKGYFDRRGRRCRCGCADWFYGGSSGSRCGHWWYWRSGGWLWHRQQYAK